MIDALKLIRYNIWAHRKLLEQVKNFTQDDFSKEIGGSFPSLQKTFHHVLESDWIWTHRFKGIPLVTLPTDWHTDNAAAIQNVWYPLQDQMQELTKDLAREEFRELRFTTRSGDTYQMAFLDLVIHVANHGTYHRGQIVNMIRALGEKPVNTDYFIFCALSATEIEKYSSV